MSDDVVGVRIFWSDEDEAWIGVDDRRPGCSAAGDDEDDVRRELVDAMMAWDEAKAATAPQPQAEAARDEWAAHDRDTWRRQYYEMRGWKEAAEAKLKIAMEALDEVCEYYLDAGIGYSAEDVYNIARDAKARIGGGE